MTSHSELPTSENRVSSRSRPGGCRGYYAHRISDAQYAEKLRAKCRVNDNGCWIYQGYKHTKGYGDMSYRNKRWSTHRLSYHLAKGPIPAGMMVLHRCDVPSCCNPLHLFVGTNDDNMADKTRKGRHHAFRATQCPHGHPYDEENTYWRPPSKQRANPARACRACARARNKRGSKAA